MTAATSWHTVNNQSVWYAVEQKAEALAVDERALAEQQAQLHNQQDLLRQEQALVEEAAAAAEQDRKQAQDMLKVQLHPTSNHGHSSQTFQAVLRHAPSIATLSYR